MKKHLNFINVGLIIFAIICLICPVLWLFEIELYFDILGGIISFDVFFFAFVFFVNLLYLKLATLHYRKTGNKNVIFIWGLPIIIGLPVLILGVVFKNVFLALALAVIILIITLFVFHARWFEFLLSVTLSFLTCMFTIVIYFVMLMILPMNNTHFESYEKDGVHYVESYYTHGVDPTTAPRTIYRMTSPITMVEIE